ncbi:hypothetical protein NSTC731_02448 [Nostoc sp. DSM 114167]
MLMSSNILNIFLGFPSAFIKLFLLDSVNREYEVYLE